MIIFFILYYYFSTTKYDIKKIVSAVISRIMIMYRIEKIPP